MVAQRKEITISVVLGEDRRLIIDLPPDAPIGEVEVNLVVSSTSAELQTIVNPAREAARAKLLAAGKLSTIWRAPEGAVALTEEELIRIGTLSPGSPTIADFIKEERGEY